MIVFPMAGLSRRFTEAGYSVPKYMLQARGKSVFAHVVGGFSAYFRQLPFLFILRDVDGSAEFVADELNKLGVTDARLAILDEVTAGQAETVERGLKRASIGPDEPLTVFNIDTIRPNFLFPDSFDLKKIDGYLEVFRGSGKNWSYVLPVDPGSDRVAETAEKVPISDLCCTGLYHFGTAGLFLDAYERFNGGLAAEMHLKELFVAPMYNLLLKDGRDIRYHVISPDEVMFCGVPSEYEAFCKE